VNVVTRTLDALVDLGVTHVVGIPDNTSGPLFRETPRRQDIRLITATREGEAVALAAGLWLGGASPLVVIQNTGLLEAGDGLRGTAVRMAAPIPLLVTGRGYGKMERAGFAPSDERTIESLTRPDVDSTALLTEPTLEVRSESPTSDRGRDEVDRRVGGHGPVGRMADDGMEAAEWCSDAWMGVPVMRARA